VRRARGFVVPAVDPGPLERLVGDPIAVSLLLPIAHVEELDPLLKAAACANKPL
jgi:hypothetical protein